MRYEIPGTRLHLKHLCPRGPSCSPGERQTKDLHIRVSMVRHGLHDVESHGRNGIVDVNHPAADLLKPKIRSSGGGGGGHKDQLQVPHSVHNPCTCTPVPRGAPFG